MPNENDGDDRIRALQKQRDVINDQIKRLASDTAEIRRKRNARRNFLAGEVALNFAAKNAEFAKVFFKILDMAIKGRERALFELDSDLRSAFTYAGADYRKKPKRGSNPRERPEI